MRRRLAFLGDSITDGHTLILQVEQALAADGVAATCFNCAVAGDRVDQMRARLECDVLPLQPTTVCISAGINDAMQGVATEVYRGHMKAILATLTAAGIEPLILTPTLLAPQHHAARDLAQAYTGALWDLATPAQIHVVDIGAAMAAAIAAGAAGLISPDGIHIEEPGYCAMAACVMAGLVGHAYSPIPPRPRWEALGGLLREWNIAAISHSSDDATALGGVAWTVPETTPCAAWWDAQEQARGFAQGFASKVPGTRWTADTELPASLAGTLSVGGFVRQVTLDGVVLFHDETFHGWHVRPLLELPASSQPRRLQLTTTGAFAATFCPFSG